MRDQTGIVSPAHRRTRRIPRHIFRRAGICPLVAAACLLAAGCSGHKTYPVEGTATLADGTPLGGLRVTLISDQPPVSATGVTDDRGHFVLGTLKVSDGAPAGTYRVVVSEAAKSDLPPPPRTHARYARPETSGLEFTVKPERNELVLKLDPATPRRR